MISGNDMTVEAALTKLSYVLGHDELTLEEKKEVKPNQLLGVKVLVTPRLFSIRGLIQIF